MSKKNDSGDKSYEVGYGKPPVSRRFGQPEGNPINRKGAPNKAQKLMRDRFSHEAMRRAFLDAGQETVSVLDNEGNKIKLPKINLLPTTLLNAALKGNVKAADLYMRYTDGYAKIQDDEFFELLDLSSKIEDRCFQASLNTGNHEHYEAMYSYFMLRRTMRNSEGSDNWVYLADEPVTEEDWKVFMEYYESFKSPEVQEQAWPPPYPSRLEEERYDNLSEEDKLLEHYQLMKHRKEMREKEGLKKWPYMVEEPVTDDDWEQFEQHIQDRLDGKESPTPWPPEGWGEDLEE